MKRGYTKFTLQDFNDFPIWELTHSLTTAEPYKGEIPFKPDKFRAFFVRTRFTFASGADAIGWTMVCVPPYDVHSLSPTILTEEGPVDLTKLAKEPKSKDVENAYRRLRNTPTEIFPLRFQTDVSIPAGPAKGELKGFLHRLRFSDENGWEQHVDFNYQTADELERALKKYREAEAAKKAALEPTKDEKALLNAAKTGREKSAITLIAKGVDVNRGGVIPDGGYTRKNVTPLMLAAENGHVEIVRCLLAAGATVDVQEQTNEPRQSGRTALACACRNNSLETALRLLEAGADPNHRLSHGQTILDEACDGGGVELLKLLLKFGANPNGSCGKNDNFALNRAIAGRRFDVAALLLESGADINCSDDSGETALFKASKGLCAERVKYLIERSADVRHVGAGGWTALHRALCRAEEAAPERYSDGAEIFARLMEVVRILVANGADVNAVNRHGDTPLSLARDCPNPELANYLVRNGAKK